jgi:hypothetical protein
MAFPFAPSYRGREAACCPLLVKSFAKFASSETAAFTETRCLGHLVSAALRMVLAERLQFRRVLRMRSKI